VIVRSILYDTLIGGVVQRLGSPDITQ
jgi:hypothetical protein